MAEKPLVTIITPTWNRPNDVLERNIRCVNSQTYENWEHVICSDGYEERVEELVREDNNPKRTYKKMDKHYNNYANEIRQKCLEEANGDYIVFYDDDNVIFPHFIEKMLGKLQEAPEDTAFTICHIIHLGPVPERLGEPPIVLTGQPVIPGNIDSLQVIIKKQALLDIGGWDIETGYMADGYTYQRLAEKYDYVELPEILCVHI